ncbi:winged helix-turn-helix domain-containing protein [Blochmannia endosymbiont of Colobopsis nipponica]|uniref:winged helix-turn-helix domain-containing protein n=1 Tax=Blochmannia endosymbiont of Colobopsis nipponica TaxID=2681987 RepID=UPI001CE3AFD7|nr:transcriptional regulator [Blochmannia endosymbiont of Colobopsis nipponica]
MNTSIKLSNSAGKVLEELIKYRDTQEPVTRKHLFYAVWENHGLEPSNGNLNQQISVIRKNLNLLGLNISAIITIPKRGLKLNNQLTIQTIKENYTNSHSAFKTNDKHKHSKLTSFKTTVFQLNTNKYMLTIFIMLITILIISTVSYLNYKNINNKKLYFCKQVNSCNICSLNPIPGLECNEYNLQISEATNKILKTS